MKYILLFTLMLFGVLCHAQYEDDYDEEQEKVVATDFFIPSAPAFALLGVNPELVTRPGSVKKFKVDWRIKNYNLAPDLALEATPLWHFYYKNKGLDHYRKSSALSKKLTTMSVSFGTAKIDGVNHASLAAKMNLYEGNDPMQDTSMYNVVYDELGSEIDELQLNIDSLRFILHGATEEEAESINGELREARTAIKDLHKQELVRLQELNDEYLASHWNRTMLDFGVGKVYTYDNAALDSLNMQGSGWGIWFNGAKRMGNNGLLGGILKITKVGENFNRYLGVSYRYGNEKHNFFGEILHESMGNFFEEGFEENEIFADNFSEDLGSGWVDFENQQRQSKITMAYGGDFKLNNNIMLNFAIRTELNGDLSFSKLLPVANIVCLMQ